MLKKYILLVILLAVAGLAISAFVMYSNKAVQNKVASNVKAGFQTPPSSGYVPFGSAIGFRTPPNSDYVLSNSEAGFRANFKVAPEFDTTGAIISDPSGAVLNAHESGVAGGVAVPVTGADFKVAPMFDATGAIISDHSGTVLNAHESGIAAGVAVPMTSADFKVALSR